MNHVFVPRQSDDCPFVADCGDAPACNCAADETCIQIGRTCTTCPTVQCIPNNNSGNGSKGSGGISKGSLAGAIVGVMLFLAVAAIFFVWYRRRWLKRRADAKQVKEVKDVPASAADVLNRPDPNEKRPSVMQEQSTVRVYSSSSDRTIDLDPESQRGDLQRRTSTQSNPFADRHSIQTTSTGSQSTNVIPIALVPPGSSSQSATSSFASPIRPRRSADLNLNLEHVNVSNESVPSRGAYEPSERSGISARRMSAMTSATNASYSSDFMEAPTIITPTQGAIRQVLGVVKAEVIQAPASTPGTPMSASSLKPNSIASKPSVRSPLATTSFGPADVVKESDSEAASDPFKDERSAIPCQNEQSPSASVTTFGTPCSDDPRSSHLELEDPRLPWAQSGDFSRPTSVSTQAGTIIAELGSATRVNVGLGELSPHNVPYEQTVPHSAGGGSVKTIHRMTSGRLVTPPSGAKPGALEEQQLRALAHAEAQAQAQRASGGKNVRRFSGTSVVSRASTHADSILESFPFVPPSPISDRPARTPPHSPLTKEAAASVKTKTSGADSQQKSGSGKGRARPSNPPTSSRRTLGMSTVSQASAMSTGLGSFPFQIDTMNDLEHSPAPSSTFAGRQRASLDTLALTSDLSSYPLGFDQDRGSTGPSARR